MVRWAVDQAPGWDGACWRVRACPQPRDLRCRVIPGSRVLGSHHPGLGVTTLWSPEEGLALFAWEPTGPMVSVAGRGPLGSDSWAFVHILASSPVAGLQAEDRGGSRALWLPVGTGAVELWGPLKRDIFFFLHLEYFFMV